jgi:hypothetical protein
MLRQPPEYTRAEKLAYVDEVIRILEMEDYADAIVGVPGSGLNVERMSIPDRLLLKINELIAPRTQTFDDWG